MWAVVVSAMRQAIRPYFTLVESLANGMLADGLAGQQEHDPLVTGCLLGQRLRSLHFTNGSGCKLHP